MYFKNKEDTVPTGMFNFEIIPRAYTVCKPKEVEIELHIEGMKRVFRFQTENYQIRDEWAEVIVSFLKLILSFLR